MFLRIPIQSSDSNDNKTKTCPSDDDWEMVNRKECGQPSHLLNISNDSVVVVDKSDGDCELAEETAFVGSSPSIVEIDILNQFRAMFLDKNKGCVITSEMESEWLRSIREVRGEEEGENEDCGNGNDGRDNTLEGEGDEEEKVSLTAT